METPSSVRMANRSQTSIASQKSKKEEATAKSRPNALVDITNDSPIVGLAAGSLSEKTPQSSAVKNRDRAARCTPGSGEALLRGQVKTLLQKVEEEAEPVHNNNTHRPQFRVLLDLPGPSPVQILAPTPANTPQVPGLPGLAEANGVKNLPPIQVAQAVKPAEESQECLISRALLFDSPGKSEVTDSSSAAISSSVSNQDDSSSAWSMQVNVDVQDDEVAAEGEEIEDFNDEEEEAEDGFHEEPSVDELCEGLSKMAVAEFAGKHTRFVYNSDDEIEGEEVIGGDGRGGGMNGSPGVLVLRGLPVPEGKHLRFHDEEGEE